MSKFQGEIEAVTKDASNPFYKSRYATLAAVVDAVRKPLAKHGLSFVQLPSNNPATSTLKLSTILMHTSGEFIEESYEMVPADNKPQTVGSCLSYMRRYSLQSILGVASDDDDDGNRASGTGPKKPGKVDITVDTVPF